MALSEIFSYEIGSNLPDLEELTPNELKKILYDDLQELGLKVYELSIMADESERTTSNNIASMSAEKLASYEALMLMPDRWELVHTYRARRKDILRYSREAGLKTVEVADCLEISIFTYYRRIRLLTQREADKLKNIIDELALRGMN